MSLEFLKTIREQLINWIRETFFPVPKKFLETSDGVNILPGSERSQLWVPRRKHLKHTTFSFPEQLKGRRRNAALDLKVEAWAPFNDPGYAVLWNGNRASVFAWDREAISRSMRNYGLDPRRHQVAPEIFLREPLKSGVRLVELSDGVEAQVWRDEFVTSTRWWNTMPSQKDWLLFKRSAASETESDLSAPLQKSLPAWLDKPWNVSVAKGDLLGQLLLNKAVIVPLVLVLMVPFIFFFGQWAGYAALNNRQTTEIVRIESEGQTVRQERSRALAALESAESLASLRQFPRQIEIISRAHALLSPYLVQISGWDYDQGTLEFGLKSESDMDATVYIPLFENDAMFYRVSASTRGERLILRMNISQNVEL